MLHFDSDYMEGAHPLILEMLQKTNMEQTAGYGCDEYCERARQKIKDACGIPGAEVHFMVGGTQTNATVIKALLRCYEGVLSADSGHICHHEAGAVEAQGHKVLTLPQQHGKITAAQVDKYIHAFKNDGASAHLVKPGMVYISHPTEYGTLYTKSELAALSEVCQKNRLPLYLDGARLGYGLAVESSDLSLKDIAKYCDIFYIGGTKAGAFFGEAVVITKQNLVDHFFTTIKQQGALLAKGRLLGIQFEVLFTNNRYIEICRHAINMADKLRSAFKTKKYKFYIDSPTNQIFIVLNKEQMQKLSAISTFSLWENIDKEYSAVRFATSWATKESDIDKLIKLL